MNDEPAFDLRATIARIDRQIEEQHQLRAEAAWREAERTPPVAVTEWDPRRAVVISLIAGAGGAVVLICIGAALARWLGGA